MKTYKIIHDTEQLNRFIEWLPDLEPNERFYYSLFARKKYCPELIKSNDRTQIKRGISKKEFLINKFEQLELPLGKLHLREVPVPQEGLVVYINPNPRDLRKAAYAGAMKLHKMVFENAKGFNPITEVTSCIQKTKSYTYVVDFDIDTKDIDLSLLREYFKAKDERNLTEERFNEHMEKTLLIIETRGGYHILVRPASASYLSKSWHQDIKAMYPCDQSGDQLCPVPGTIQGGFVPKIIDL